MLEVWNSSLHFVLDIIRIVNVWKCNGFEFQNNLDLFPIKTHVWRIPSKGHYTWFTKNLKPVHWLECIIEYRISGHT